MPGCVRDKLVDRSEVVKEDAVSDEAVADPGAHRDFAQGFGHGKARGGDLGGCGLVDDDFQEPHDMGRGKEVEPHDIPGPPRGRGDLIEIEARGDGGENGAGVGDGIELCEDLLFEIHVLEDGFDDDVRLGKAFKPRGGCEGL